MCKMLRTKVFAITSVLMGLLVTVDAVADQTYICRFGDSIREIHVLYDEPGVPVPCSVTYRKAEGDQTLWRATVEEGFCEQNAEAFVSKQRSWGWECSLQEDESQQEESSPVESAPDAANPQAQGLSLEEQNIEAEDVDAVMEKTPAQ